MCENSSTESISIQSYESQNHSQEAVLFKQDTRDCKGGSLDHNTSILENDSSCTKVKEVSKLNDMFPKRKEVNGQLIDVAGTLQDVSLDNSYVIGCRSSTANLHQYPGSTSPVTQGRSVREFEEQMATLRKENFNLKLRLYFIEESIPGYQQANSPEGQETLMKQLIDTRVEMEILRKEVQEKQEILKEAAHAMNQMETIQKETESKNQALVDELNQKIQFLEMEREVETPLTGKCVNNLLDCSDLTQNVIAVKRIHDLESVLKQSENKITDLQKQINALDDILAKRDDTINEYEEKVKELVFQNAELLESLDSKEKNLSNAEHNLENVKKCIYKLKNENLNLMDVLTVTQDTYQRETSNLKLCKNQMCKQQEALTKMQSTISIKTANTARLLERIQEYEKLVTKMNFERNLVKRENRLFRAIIGKLQYCNNNNQSYTINKNKVYHQFNSEYNGIPLRDSAYNRLSYDSNYHGIEVHSDFHGEYKLKQKVCVNFCNAAKFSTGSSSVDICNLNLLDDEEKDFDSEIPIRYTFHDGSMFAVNGSGFGRGSGIISKTNSCSSLQANFSSSSIAVDSNEIYEKLHHCREELQEFKSKLADKICMLEEAKEQLKNRTQIHEQACRTIQKLMQRIKNQQREIKKLKNQACETPEPTNNNDISDNGEIYLVEDEFNGLCNVMNDNEVYKCRNDLELKFGAVIRDKDAIIERLKTEVKKKTANLQNLVNNELWEKNREIERLTKLINKTKPHITISPKKNISSNHSFSDSEYLKVLERNQFLQKKVDVLIQRLCDDRNNDELISLLRDEVRDARNEAECTEKWRLECVEICSMLSNRLEELAGFLNSLLMHKDVFGLLAADKHSEMRKAIEHSLDLSKSLNLTLSVSGFSIVEHSLLHLSNISELLADGLNKTFNSHEELHTQKSIETLKVENKALKNQLKKCHSADTFNKDRRSLPIGANNAQSESEAWSEPDRKVSLARIGLDELSNSLDKSVSGVGATVNLLETDSESESINKSRSFKTGRAIDRISYLEQIISKRDDRILKIQCQLVAADNRMKEENFKVLSLTCEVEQLRKYNKELQENLFALRSCSHDKSIIEDESLLRKQIKKKSYSIEQMNDERDRITVDAHVSAIQIESLKAEIENLKTMHEEAINFTHEKHNRKLNQLQTDLQDLMQKRLSEQERQQKESLKHDWISRNLYEITQNKLKELENQLKEAHNKIDFLNENEKELKQSIVDSELTMRSMKKQLDESTLQISKVILERTKALTEKLKLEKCIQELNAELQSNEIESNALKCKIQYLEDTYSSKLRQISRDSTNLNSSNVSKFGSATNYNEISEGKVVDEFNTLRLSNTSPDLGIESDAGRATSVEISNTQLQVLKTVEVSVKNTLKEESINTFNNEDIKPSNLPKSMLNSNPPHDCVKVDQENVELRRKLTRTKRSLMQTYEQLRISNQRKAQIEQDIKKQIVKTHTVLRNVRSNMEN